MTNEELALALSRCESEDAVESILINESLWNNNKCWKPFGDNENNFAIIGNQQESADSALVEKIVNSIDAMLIKECLIRKINPESSQAPQSIQEALHQFYNIKGGNLSELTTKESTELAKNGIVLAASGSIETPCYTLIDKGEGQTPNRMPDTILSISKSNKLKIPFVQGQFNMGGTGVLPFCGNKRLQLIISKKCPQIENMKNDDSFSQWGFTIVRRETAAAGRKSSMYTYLTDEAGNIKRFDCTNGLPLLPKRENVNDNIEYLKLEYGMYIKMFNYNIPVLQTSIISRMMFRLSLLLPGLPYPVRLVETRTHYKSKSPSGTLTGLITRLSRNKAEGELEDNFPFGFAFKVNGQNISGSIYAFKDFVDDKEIDMKKYKNDEGVIFIRNGQTHGTLKKSIFKAAKLGYMEDHILILLECSHIDIALKEDMFMNSRDRIRRNTVSAQIEDNIIELLKENELLKTLNNDRRKKKITKAADDDKPFVHVLENMLKKSATLQRLFINGLKLQNPINMAETGQQKKEYDGKRFPTFFNLKKKQNIETLIKEVPLGHKGRVQFETDAVNDYFSREEARGEYSLYENGSINSNSAFNLYNGIGNLNITLPESAKIGDSITYELHISDNSRAEPFSSSFTFNIISEIDTKSNNNGTRVNPPSGNSGTGRLKPSGLNLPKIEEIGQIRWNEFDMNKDSSLIIKSVDDSTYDFFVNIDNIHLLTELKASMLKDDESIKLMRAKYKYSMVLIGLAAINYFKTAMSDDKEISVEDFVKKLSEAASPVILPIIDSMSELNLSDFEK